MAFSIPARPRLPGAGPKATWCRAAWCRALADEAAHARTRHPESHSFSSHPASSALLAPGSRSTWSRQSVSAQLTLLTVLTPSRPLLRGRLCMLPRPSCWHWQGSVACGRRHWRWARGLARVDCLRCCCATICDCTLCHGINTCKLVCVCVRVIMT